MDARLRWHREAAARDEAYLALGPDDDSETDDSPWRNYGTSGGVPLTDEKIQELADEAERGYDPDQLAKRLNCRHEHGGTHCHTRYDK
jgi:hypothetical protein